MEDLTKYKAASIYFTTDPNAGLIYDKQNPQIEVLYKNPNGDIKTRKYNGLIKLIGLKVDFSIRINFIYFINTDFNYSNSDKTIILGKGLEITLGSLIVITYAKFENLPGGILIGGIAVGPCITLSLVLGGSLTPID